MIAVNFTGTTIAKSSGSAAAPTAAVASVGLARLIQLPYLAFAARCANAPTRGFSVLDKAPDPFVPQGFPPCCAWIFWLALGGDEVPRGCSRAQFGHSPPLPYATSTHDQLRRQTTATVESPPLAEHIYSLAKVKHREPLRPAASVPAGGRCRQGFLSKEPYAGGETAGTFKPFGVGLVAGVSILTT
jgi:hypothetical protein